MTLDKLRADIDRIDARILALLDERMEKAALTRRLKKSGVYDPAREADVLARVARRSRCLAREEFTTGLYRNIMAESKALQEKNLRLVGFQGVHGAYSEAAIRAWDPEAAAVPFPEFGQVFDEVQAGSLDYGVVPVENTLGGIVGQVNSILVTTQLRIVAAVDLPVVHCLLAAPGQDHREIRTAYSHPQALAQCRRFLERNKLDAMVHFDTAGAARMIAEERPKGAAAIAGRFAGDLYGLEIIKEGIQDAANNRTRFFVLARTAPEAEGNKCSAVFFTNDKAGALFKVLEVFARSGINLTRIESVPNEPGDYAIFLDFEGSDRDPAWGGGGGGGPPPRRGISGSWAATGKRGSEMRIAVLGIGRMGAWLAETLARENDVAVRDDVPARAEQVAGARPLRSDAELRDFAPELLVNCVPLGFTVEVFRGILPLLPEGCTLSDIASVKTGLRDFYREAGRPFVSTHPMFGPTHANLGASLRGENAVIITESCEEGKEFFRRLYAGLDLRVFEEDFEGHDQTVAYSLATPFASTMVFAACMKRLDAPGTNFRKHLEIARSLLGEDDRLLAEILFNPHTIRQIELINSQLAYLNHIIRGKDYEEMEKYLAKLRKNLGLAEGGA